MPTVSALQHDGNDSTARTYPAAPEGVYKSTYRISLLKTGWVEPICRGNLSADWEAILSADLYASVYYLRDVLLGHAAGLLLLQGASLAQIFDGCFLTGEDRTFEPMILVKVSPPNLISPPLKLSEVVLTPIVEGQSVEELRKKVFLYLTSQ